MSSRLRFAFVVTAGFMVVEAVAGWWTGSLALMSDAGHMLTDSISLGVAVLTTHFSQQPADERHSLGHQRAEVLGAGLTAGGLVVLSAWIAVEAVGRLRNPMPVEAGGMMGVAVLGLLLNIVMAVMLMKGEGMQNRAALLNVLGDALGSVGVIVAGILVAWKGWLIADPLVSILIAGLILLGAIQVLREVVDVLMQAVPEDLDISAMKQALSSMTGVQSVHDLHAWSLRPGEVVVSVHLVLQEDAPVLSTIRAAENEVRRFVPTAHVTVQPEIPTQF